MTPKQAKAEFLAFRREVGPRAELYATVEMDGGHNALYCSIYPSGMGAHDLMFRVKADDWPELIAEARAKWAEHKDRHRAQSINKMALEIIRITHAFGSCTEAQLRGTKFTAEDIAAYGAEACSEANKMAANGPFSIAPAAGANAIGENVARGDAPLQ
jgi:hypothetical protein